jgi:exopolysaccharide production protein ExoY
MEAIRRPRAEPEVEADVLAGPPIRYIRSKASSWYRRRGKRALDLVVGGLAFFALLPVMAGVAIVVLITSGRPVLYTAERAGRDGRRFRMHKFRTMVRDADRLLQTWRELRPDLAAEYGETFKLRNDPRVTRAGRFLRTTSLDELPQLWNVLRGEMSLVGPRPVPQRELEEKYGAMAAHCFSVPPGMTGVWQVNGRSRTDYGTRVAHDAAYAAHVSPLLDLRVLLQTVPAVLLRRGAE